MTLLMKSIDALPVKIEGLIKTFPGFSNKEITYAVNDVSIDIKPGELVTLLGPSGCGKTTALRMLAGFEDPTEGKIFIGEQNVTKVAPNKRDLGMVFQSYALFPHLSVFENVAYGLRIKGFSKKEVNERVNSVLETTHLQEIADRDPSQISGGQQQRVALARAIVTEPKVLLFDEPLSNLDEKLRVYMREELRELQQRLNITSLYVTHDQSEAMAISDKIIVMNKGRIEQVGTPMEIYKKPKNKFVADFIGRANFLDAVVEQLDAHDIEVSIDGYKIVLEKDELSFSVGDSVCIIIRPEHFLLDVEGEFEGEVKSSTFYGSYVDYTIEVGTQTLSFEDFNYTMNGIKKQGEKIKLKLKDNCARALPST